MRASRIFQLVVMSAAASVAAAQGSERSQSFQVFDAVLDSLYHSHGDRPALVIVADSLHGRQAGVAYQGRFLLKHESSIDSQTIADFERGTMRSSPFPKGYRYRGRFHLLPAIEIEQIYTWGNSLASSIPAGTLCDNPFWIGFVDKYPDAWGYTVLSRAGFNPDSSQALVYVRHQCGGGCSSAEVILLEPRNRRWRIVERIDHQSREGLAIGSLRYLGPGAHMIADIRRQQDSTRKAVADSIRKDHAPRRIRGTVYNRLTGRPLPRAQLFLHSSSKFPLESITRFVADAKGRYEIRNPPIGGTMLEVQCPGPGHRRGATLDAPGLYVYPMIDTIIDVGPPSIEPCWWPRRIHRIESGELLARQMAEVAYPSEAESRVYAAIIREMHLDRTPFIIESETHPWCDWTMGCPKLTIAHLVRSGEIDSQTVASFRKLSQDSIALSPIRARRLGAELITTAERQYLEGEIARRSQFGVVPAADTTFWIELARLYNGARTIVSFTAVGFNARGDEAIAAVRTSSLNDETADTMLLKRLDGEWHIARGHLESEHPMGAIVSGRCVAEHASWKDRGLIIFGVSDVRR